MNARVFLIFLFLLLITGCSSESFMNPDLIQHFLSDAMSHQVSQFGVAFTIAAWIHSGRVKQEIKTQFGSMIESIDGVASALRQDLAAQGTRIGKIEDGMNSISARVDSLEKQTSKGEGT